MLLSPKKSSELPNSLTIKSPKSDFEGANSRGDPDYEIDPLMAGEDGLDMHQFAHLSVEDEDEDDFQEAEFLGEMNAAGLIELEEDEEDDDDDNEFDEADFKRFQE